MLGVGATPVSYATAWTRGAERPGAEVDSTEVAAWAPLVMLAEAEAQLEPASRHLDKASAGVLLYDTTTRIPARILAHRHGLPAVELHCSLAPPPGQSTIPGLRHAEDDAPLLLDSEHPARMQHRSRAQHLLTTHEYPLTDPDDVARTSERRTLVAVADLLQPDRESFDDSTVFTGPLEKRGQDAEQWRPPPPGRPVVLLTWGTEAPHPSAERLSEHAGAFTSAGYHVVMTTGPVPVDDHHLSCTQGSHVQAAPWQPVTRCSSMPAPWSPTAGSEPSDRPSNALFHW